MMVCAGPTGVPSTFSKSDTPDALKVHPVATLAPTEYVPPEFTVSSVPLLDVSVPVVAPLLSVKNRSLRFCATSVGFESKLFRVTLIVPAPVTKMADEFSRLPPVEAPLPMKVIVLASAAEPHASATLIAKKTLYICGFLLHRANGHTSIRCRCGCAVTTLAVTSVEQNPVA